MIINIENDKLLVSVDTLGAELKRLYDIDRKDELLWCGNPDIWSGTAPVLFPIVGRLRNGKYLYEGRDYSMPKHGFARTEEFTVHQQEKSSVTLKLAASENTLAFYPFQFELYITFRAEQNKLTVEYRVLNTGTSAMPFSIGSHPAISLTADNKPYTIKFNHPEIAEVFKIKNELLETEGTPYLDNESAIEITPDIFKDDALIFKNIKSDLIQLADKSASRIIEVDTGGAPHLGLWAKPQADYVCIEPWFSYDDDEHVSGDLYSKPGMITLEPSESFNTYYSIRRC